MPGWARVCECAVANLFAGWQNEPMKTLAEIERAAEELPPAERTELLLFVARSLRQEQAPLPLLTDEIEMLREHALKSPAAATSFRALVHCRHGKLLLANRVSA